ncbi:uncharacterized protein AAES06_016908 [Glossophaga mutica]
MRLGGPPGSLGWASLSGPFGPWPQGGPQSHPGRHLGGGRGRGLRAPRKGAGKISPNPRRTAGGEEARVWRAGGSQATSDPVAGRLRRRRGGPSARAKVGGIPSARARHSPGSASSGSAQSSPEGPEPGPARAASPGRSRPHCVPGAPSARTQDVLAPAPKASRAAARVCAAQPGAQPSARVPPPLLGPRSERSGSRRAPGEGPRRPRDRCPPRPATNARGQGPAGLGSAAGARAGAARGGGEQATRARGGGAARPPCYGALRGLRDCGIQGQLVMSFLPASRRNLLQCTLDQLREPSPRG